VSQLVLDVKNKDLAFSKDPSVESADITKTKLYVQHDTESILLEQPSLNPESEPEAPNLKRFENQDLSNSSKLVIQAYINLLFKSMPDKDEHTFEMIRPYINVCVFKQTNWLTFSKALLYRSKNEMQRHKMMERSLSQLQALIDQFRDQDNTTLEKIDYSFATSYPMSWGVKLQLSRNYEKIGVFMSAYELMKTIAMDEEAVKCLFLAGR